MKIINTIGKIVLGIVILIIVLVVINQILI